nr:unnamed protein product [Naegleria fowleri]
MISLVPSIHHPNPHSNSPILRYGALFIIIIIITLTLASCLFSEHVLLHAQECNYTCPRGLEKTQRFGYSPKPNGCGTQGEFNAISDELGFTHCCNKHDTCYTDCRKSKEECDEEFYRCMNQHCDTNKKKNSKTHKECKNTSSMFFMGVGLFGCDAYVLSQKEACICIDPKKKMKNEL